MPPPGHPLSTGTGRRTPRIHRQKPVVPSRAKSALSALCLVIPLKMVNQWRFFFADNEEKRRKKKGGKRKYQVACACRLRDPPLPDLVLFIFPPHKRALPPSSVRCRPKHAWAQPTHRKSAHPLIFAPVFFSPFTQGHNAFYLTGPGRQNPLVRPCYRSPQAV